MPHALNLNKFNANLSKCNKSKKPDRRGEKCKVSISKGDRSLGQPKSLLNSFSFFVQLSKKATCLHLLPPAVVAPAPSLFVSQQKVGQTLRETASNLEQNSNSDPDSDWLHLHFPFASMIIFTFFFLQFLDNLPISATWGSIENIVQLVAAPTICLHLLT